MARTTGRPASRSPARIVFVCSSCGGTQGKWFGRCPECGAWNTATEEVRAPRAAPARGAASPGASAGRRSVPRSLGERGLERSSFARMSTGFVELDRVLGGGIVPGAVVLVGGDPGIGKSTLLLQAAARLGRAGARCLYVTGEESEEQIRLRAERLGACVPEVLVVTETEIDEVLAHIAAVEPRVVVADSIQTFYRADLPSAPGTVTQVRECAFELIRAGKAASIPILLVGHVTKEGDVAGPRVLEHMVDAVLYLEGERYQELRILRAQKNRFGATTEIGLFEMAEDGLREVADPSGAFLAGRLHGVSGTAVLPSLEGDRALLVEVQALVARTMNDKWARQATGFDRRRLDVLLAVLERRAGVSIDHQDVFVSVAGGLRLAETASDLALLLAVASSAVDQALPDDLVVMGEVGLGGELRRVQSGARRLAEAARLGFKRAILPAANQADGRGIDIQLAPVADLRSALRAALGEKALPRVRKRVEPSEGPGLPPTGHSLPSP
jgi:DNA repair protein RadA/Sms